MPQTTLDELVAYLWEHGATHSLQSLQDHLMAQGYDPALIDQAVATYRAERAKLDPSEPEAELSEAPPGEGRGCLGAVLVAFGVALGNCGLLYLSFRAAAATFSGMDTHSQLTEARIGASLKLGLTLVACEVLGGFLLAALAQLFDGGPRLLVRSLGVGVLLAVPLTGVFFLIAIGACFVVLG
jgi:hypothetical protein